MRPLLQALSLFPLLLPAKEATRTDLAQASDPARLLATAINDLGARLYGRLAGAPGDAPGNLFLSPYSIAAALAMARAGAAGETAAAMDRVLGTTGLDVPAAHRALRQLLDQRQELRGDDGQRQPAFELHVAQRVFVHLGLPLEADFTRIQREQFAAPIATLDFTQTEAARRAINDWVAAATRDRIQDIVPSGLPTPDTRLALANAIYFKAAWAETFSPRLSQSGDFTMATGDVRQVPMMHQKCRWRYAEWDAAQAVELPFAGDDTALWIVLPREPATLDRLAAGMTAARLSALDQQLAPRLVDLRLPRFSCTSTHELGAALQAMGMAPAFVFPDADFGGITKAEPLVLGPVLHKAFLAVDEHGTEAAAATVVLMRVGSAARPEEPVAFHADRPFWFAIRHRPSGCVLFVGRLAAPEG